MSMDEQTHMLLEHYRRDRQKLLQFLISSSNLIKQVRSSSGSTSSLSDINLDTLSADYVISCINSGGVLDIAEATNSFYHELAYPTVIHSQSGNSFFTLSQNQLSKSPPKRRPPTAYVNDRTDVASQSSFQVEQISKHKVASRKADNGFKVENVMTRPAKSSENGVVPILGLPHLQTGLSDEDLRESAYGVLVASLVFSGIEVVNEQDRKKERSSNILAGLKVKKNREILPAHSLDRNLELLNIIRSQMEVAVVMDSCIRQSLTRRASRASSGQIDVLNIVLGLVKSISRSSFPNEKSYVQWKNRQANILEELCCHGHLTTEYATIKYSIGKIRNAREWDMMSPSERAEILSSIRDSASKISHKSRNEDGSYDLSSDHHLKVRLYENLLSSVFDILEEGQILVEANEILKLVKWTWSILGITQIIHDALYSWVLFKQFVQTDKEDLLEYTTIQTQKVLATESFYEGGECFLCTIEWRESLVKLNLVPAIFILMNRWCDEKLLNYHGHFSQESSKFKSILSFAMTTAVLDLDEFGEVLDSLDLKANLERTHPLALLANAVKLIAEKESAVFCPVLHTWCSEAGMIAATLLYQLFSERLTPFIQGISSLSQDVKVVLSAAHMLDRELSQLYYFSYKGNHLDQPLKVDLDHFQIGEVSASIILDWLISQHAYILDWIGRAFDLEEWEPLSTQQKHAVSIVEVFRMIEETVDQFFGLKLPVNITHLQALLSLVIHSLDAYLTKVLGQLVDKNLLYPSAPSLTRYEETTIPMPRKKMVELRILDDNSTSALKQLTVSKLCIRLNTLQYIKNQVILLEDDMRKSWGLIRPFVKRRWFNIVDEVAPEILERTMSMSKESIDELFATTFDGIKKSTTDAISKVIDFTGTKALFWDLRESFLFQLYCGGIERARMDTVLPKVDVVLNQVCGLVDDSVRDPVVLSIFHASLEGYLWVLLDGGPSRAFSDSDVNLLEDDLRALQDFFVADGEGLPRSTVERDSKFAHQVLSLFSLQTSSIIQMLMTASDHISTRVQSRSHGHRSLDNANTLIRILCHKKDIEASKFLKKHYRLPPSSEYEDNPKNESTLSSAIITDLLKRSASFRFPDTGHSSFKSLKKKFQEGW
ncbi:protein unc-13 homolog isoform X2 [Amaranthus tricolor]|uniref:protein unc-13 homolog isoform X2 n=1 Tax=Amaranthus tricolor TaxID=29722 RepID=UPI00258CF271|nr:protein unc-13 homolog isoform X2 [Amaranthus tricolor]